MPSMANITVKKYDGTTDIVYTALSPSGGDSTPAQWRVDSIGTIPSNRPFLSVSSKYTANRQARVITTKLVYPETVTDSTTGLTSVRLTTSDSYTRIIPLNGNDATAQESAAQFANLLKSTLLQQTMQAGFAPT